MLATLVGDQEAGRRPRGTLEVFMRKLSIMAVAALLAGAPAAAQQGHHGQHQMPMMDDQARQGMEHCMSMLGGPPPHMLLQNREPLGLGADQVNRLETLQSRARETAMAHMQPAMQAHMAAAELLKGDAPDFTGYEARLREAADHMVRAHTAMARVAVEARNVLTAEQQAKLKELGGTMRGMSGAGQHPMGGGQHGTMPEGMAGMMGCMMMDMGGGQSGADEHNH